MAGSTDFVSHQNWRLQWLYIFVLSKIGSITTCDAQGVHPNPGHDVRHRVAVRKEDQGTTCVFHQKRSSKANFWGPTKNQSMLMNKLGINVWKWIPNFLGDYCSWWSKLHFDYKDREGAELFCLKHDPFPAVHPLSAPISRFRPCVECHVP